MLMNQKNPGRKPLIPSSLKEQRLNAGRGNHEKNWDETDSLVEGSLSSFHFI